MADRYASLKQGLVGCWIPSISGSGLLLPDLSGRGNNGSLVGMDASDWVSASYGRALDFDGVNDYVDTNYTPGTVSALTISAWLKKTASTRAYLLAGGAADQFTTNGIGFELYETVAYINAHNNSVYQFAQFNWNETGWHHWCYVFNGAGVNDSSRLRVFVDGIQQTLAFNSTIAATLTAVSSFRIAQRFWAVSYSQNQADDIRIYNRALSESEIKLLASEPGIGFKPAKKLSRFSQRFTYNPPKARNYSVVRVKETDYATLRQGLVGAWCPSLPNGGSGNTLPDVSGYNNHGSLVNMSPDDWVSSQYGRALDFDGVNDYLDTGNDGAFRASAKEFSFFCWVYASTTSFLSAPKVIADSAGFNVSSGGFWIALDNRGGSRATAGIGVQVKTVSGLAGRDASADNIFTSTPSWKHVGFVYSNSSLRIFVNGIDATTREAAIVTGTGDYEPKNAKVTIGASNDIANFATMLIDDMRSYSRKVSEPEIRLLASRPGIGLRQESHRNTFYQFPSFQPAIARRSSAIIGGGIT